MLELHFSGFKVHCKIVDFSLPLTVLMYLRKHHYLKQSTFNAKIISQLNPVFIHALNPLYNADC